MSRSVGVVLVMLLVAVAVAACGGASGDQAGGPPATTATTARTVKTQAATTPAPADVSDEALATRALVRLADLPQGWTEERGTVTRLQCGTFQPFRGAKALVRSKRLTHDHYGVQERVAVYATVAAARDALRRLDSVTAANCLRRELRRHVSEEAGAPASPARLVRMENLGPTATARRYISRSVNQYGSVIGFIDAVHVRIGRALAALVFVSGPAVPDVDLYEHVAELAPKHLRAALG